MEDISPTFQKDPPTPLSRHFTSGVSITVLVWRTARQQSDYTILWKTWGLGGWGSLIPSECQLEMRSKGQSLGEELWEGKRVENSKQWLPTGKGREILCLCCLHGTHQGNRFLGRIQLWYRDVYIKERCLACLYTSLKMFNMEAT